MNSLSVIAIIFSTLSMLSSTGLVVFLYLQKKDTVVDVKADSYKDYRDPVTGLLRANKQKKV